MKKLEAINGDKIRALTLDDFLSRALPFLIREKVITGKPDEVEQVKKALPIIQERIARLKEVVPMLRFLFVEEVYFEDGNEEKLKESQTQEVLQSAISSLENVSVWSHQEIENALRAALLEEMGLKPRIAFGPVRIAITGSHISPPLFESMELLGRERSMQRLRAAIN